MSVVERVVSAQLQIDGAYQAALAASGLVELADFMRFAGGRRVSRPEKHPVRVLELNMDGGPQLFYLKQFRWSVAGVATDLFKRRWPLLAGTTRERRVLALLESKGIAVMRAVAWGERKLLGLPLYGFLLSEKVAGQEFVDVYQRSDIPQRRRLRRLHGSLVGCVHRENIWTKIRPNDLFVVSDDWSDFRRCLVVIDRERGLTRPVELSPAYRAKQLADIWVKSGIMTGLGTATEQRAFLAGYFASLYPAGITSDEKADFVDTVLRQAALIIRRHRASEPWREEFRQRFGSGSTGQAG